MNQIKEQMKPVIEKAKVIIDTFYFVVFLYGAHQLFTNLPDLLVAIDVIAKK